MATHYSFKKKYDYDVAWKCEHCGKINIQRCQKELEKGYRTSTKYTQKARMEENERFQSEAQGELREQAAKFENEINNGETLLSLNLKGKCSGCGKEQRWKYNKFLEDYAMIVTLILSVAAVGIICYFVLHLSTEACLAISLLGGPLLGMFCGNAYLTQYEKIKFKRLNSIKDPEARPLIIGDITKKKILENSDPKLANDARVIEWKRRREEARQEYEKAKEKSEKHKNDADEGTNHHTDQKTEKPDESSAAGRQKSVQDSRNGIQAGDLITLGSYPQGKDGTRQPVEWTVMEVLEHKALLLSRRILDMKPFDKEKEPVFWNSSSLREWLNDEFLKEAFSAEDLEKIAAPEGKPGIGEEIRWKMARTEPDTSALSDRVFLLKVMDIVKYFPGTESFACPGARAEATDWVKETYGDSDAMWWLRTSRPDAAGPDSLMGPMACIVSPSDTVGFSLISENNLQGVRPAVWLKLDGYQPEIYGGGTVSFRISVGNRIEPSDSGELAISFNAGTTQDQIQSVLNMFAFAVNGDTTAAAAISALYWNGNMVMQDDDLSFFWAKLAAKEGNAEAQCDLADCYMSGVGVRQDEEKAHQWMKKAADQGLGNAQANLGNWYVNEGNTEEGEKLLRSAVEKHENNWQYANTELARALMEHEDQASKKEALELAETAAKENYPLAIRLLCQVYYYGINGRTASVMDEFIDPLLGSIWLDRGAAIGESYCLAEKANKLMNQDSGQLDEALRLARLSADQEYSYGCYICGCVLEKKGDLKQALEYYQKAVEFGDRSAESDVRRLEMLV